MAERRSFLLRIDPAVLDAVQRWANDDLRSLNGQIEFLLRHGLKESGRSPDVHTPRARRPRTPEKGPGQSGEVDTP